MSPKHSKLLSLSRRSRDRDRDYLKIIKKESINLDHIIDQCSCNISVQRFPTSSLKHSYTSHRSKSIPIIKKKSYNTYPSFARDNYGWYKVTIPFGHKYSKESIISKILKYIYPFTFTPVMYKDIEDKSIFYVDKKTIADEISKCDKKIKTNDNYRIMIKVTKGYPWCDFDENLSKKLKYVTSKRLCETTRSLDLSHFYCDPYLVDNYFCALFIPKIFFTIMNFAYDFMPDLEILYLEKNNLRLTKNICRGISKFSKLKVIYLNNNIIKDIKDFNGLKNSKLEELFLINNPIYNNYIQSKEEYRRILLTIFPSLIILDGYKVSLSTVFEFDKGEDEKEEIEVCKLPSTLKNHYPHSEIRKIAKQFIKKYFDIYDGDSRDSLLSLYHELAFFSMNVSLASLSSSQESGNIEDYLPFHRNLITKKVSDQRMNFVKQGRLPIVTLISLLPKTYHYLNSFSTDVILQTVGTMMICISGCFKELNTKGKSMFYFNRTFIIKLEADDCVIINDQLYVSYPTPKQKEQALDNFCTVVSSAPSPTSTTAVASSPLPLSTPMSSLITPPPTPVLSTANTESDNSTSSSEMVTEPTIKSEFLSTSTSSEPELTDSFKEKLINLRGIIGDCMSAIDGFLDDIDNKEKLG
ncbi:nuclear RNA export factor 1 isoform X2 [Microplitis demolitor]|nr:nuclear RNA export factor 1 isoform X2 [Microplitis demolitor]XP_053593389.1 nuclear RNA export factor 1 isoform X2 [Microplitis demolitor]XP_053593392.1 nuclear RNA export factor 1 isoform X2 [Microplitis demolitor]